jgi:HEAT repeat protein
MFISKQGGLIILMASVVVGLLFWQLRKSESTTAGKPNRIYNGKTTRAWVKEAITNESYESHQALTKIGEEAVPFIVPTLKIKDSTLNRLYVKAWTNFPSVLQQRLQKPMLASDARMRAVVALREMGPSGKAAVPALIERLSDSDGTIRLHSAIALGNMGSGAKEAVPYLKPFLQDKRHTVRVYVANALWKIEHDAKLVLPVLEQGIQEDAAPFRWAAAAFIGELGSEAERAAPSVEKATHASDKETASLAVQSLAQIRPKAVPIIIEILKKDPDPGMRISAAYALGRLGPAAVESVPTLIKSLDDQERGLPVIFGANLTAPITVHQAAADALKKIDPMSAAQAGVQ